jgi:hypothetical protein
MPESIDKLLAKSYPPEGGGLNLKFGRIKGDPQAVQEGFETRYFFVPEYSFAMSPEDAENTQIAGGMR